jgi:hypothetical protein
VRTDEVEGGAGPLVEHVAVEMFGAQQGDAAVERFTLAIELGEPRLRQLDFLGQAKPREQTALALDEMVSEITHQADAEDRPSNKPRAFPDFLNNPHEVRESRASRRVKSLFAALANICPPGVRRVNPAANQPRRNTLLPA